MAEIEVEEFTKVKNFLNAQDTFYHSLWHLARQGDADVYEAAAGLYTLVFYRGTEYTYAGRLRMPRYTRQYRLVRLYVGRQWETTRHYTLYERGVIGESGKARDRLESLTRSIETTVTRLFGITDVRWNRH